jgi:hypothetical protein
MHYRKIYHISKKMMLICGIRMKMTPICEIRTLFRVRIQILWNVHFGHNSLTICISYDMVMEVLINSRLGLALMKMLRFIQSYEKLMMRSV